MTEVVLDASALIAVLRREPGADVVKKHLQHALISAVNYAEVLKKTIERGGEADPVRAYCESFALRIIPFDDRQAEASAALYPLTKPLGLSFADRACLALGVQQKVTVLTTERKMGKLQLPVPIELIRNAH